MMQVQRSAVELKDVDSDASLSDVIKAYNELADMLNYTLKFLSFRSNFDGYIPTVKILASSTLQIPHFLGVIPKYRILLRQEGNGLITDVPTSWTTDYITLKNNGTEDVTISVLIARE